MGVDRGGHFAICPGCYRRNFECKCPDLGPLFAPAPFSDHGTSLQAARSIGPHLERLEEHVLEIVRRPGGRCAHEIESALSLSGNTVRPRLVALAGKGLIRKSDRTRLTPSGRSAAVWEAV